MASVPPPYSSRDHAQGKLFPSPPLLLSTYRDPWAHLGRLHSSARTPVQQRLIKLAYTRILRNHFSLSRMENHWFEVNV